VTLADLHAAARTLACETLTDLDRQGVDRLGADWWCGRLSFALEALCNSLDELDASEELAGGDDTPEPAKHIPDDFGRPCGALSETGAKCHNYEGHDGCHAAASGRLVTYWDAS
jgi:hypothetical protein